MPARRSVLLLVFVALMVLAGRAHVLWAVPLSSAVHLLVLVDGAARRRCALVAHAAAAVLFVPGAQRLTAKHEVVVLDDGEGHPGLLVIKAVEAVVAAAAAAAAVARRAAVAVTVHLDAAVVVVVVVAVRVLFCCVVRVVRAAAVAARGGIVMMHGVCCC